MANYMIRIYKQDENGVYVEYTMITCTTVYRITEDIAEWVREEIDADANIQTSNDERDDEEVNTTNGTDWFGGNPQAGTICRDCKDGWHDNCIDGGLSSAPYTCKCAYNRHERTTEE